MNVSILLASWAALAFVLYRITLYTLAELRHRRNAQRLGCEQPVLASSVDFLGILNLYHILQADKEHRMPAYLKERVDSASEREGKVMSTFYQNQLGSPAVFTVEPRNIQTILATKFKDFGLGSSRNGNFYPLLGWGIFSTDGKEWEHGRALLRPQFARDQVSDLDLEERHVQNMMRGLLVNSDGWTSTVDIKTLFFRLTMDSATEFLFGESVNSQLASLPGYTSSKSSALLAETNFAVSFDRAQATLSKGVRFGDMYRWTHNEEFKENCRRCHAFIDHYVQLALAKEKPSSQMTTAGKQKYVFLDALAEATRDPIEIRSHLVSILLAGRDTTASLLSFVFMTFIQRPDVYAKLRSIILEQFGTYSEPREIIFSRLKSCNYLQWVLNETLRLYPVVPLDGRRAMVDTTLPTGGGPDGKSPVYIRKDMQVDYSVYVMHRRKDLWGADADEFRPERWDGRRSGWEYLPFNGGPRICIGQQFALTEAGYVIVRTLQKFDRIEGVGNSWEPVEKGGAGYVRMGMTLTSSPAEGVNVRLREANE